MNYGLYKKMEIFVRILELDSALRAIIHTRVISAPNPPRKEK